jgi:hypothetical protein
MHALISLPASCRSHDQIPKPLQNALSARKQGFLCTVLDFAAGSASIRCAGMQFVLLAAFEHPFHCVKIIGNKKFLADLSAKRFRAKPSPEFKKGHCQSSEDSVHVRFYS